MSLSDRLDINRPSVIDASRSLSIWKGSTIELDESGRVLLALASRLTITADSSNAINMFWLDLTRNA